MNQSHLFNGMHREVFERCRKEVYEQIAANEALGMTHDEALLQIKGFQARGLTDADSRRRFRIKDRAYKSTPEMLAKGREYVKRYWARKLGLERPEEEVVDGKTRVKR